MQLKHLQDYSLEKNPSSPNEVADYKMAQFPAMWKDFFNSDLLLNHLLLLASSK